MLDLFATNLLGNIILAKVIPSTLSDYDMIVVVRKINVSELPPCILECRSFSSYGQMAFWEDVYKEKDVNSAWMNWKQQFLSVCNKHAPVCCKVVRG